VCKEVAGVKLADRMGIFGRRDDNGGNAGGNEGAGENGGKKLGLTGLFRRKKNERNMGFIPPPSDCALSAAPIGCTQVLAWHGIHKLHVLITGLDMTAQRKRSAQIGRISI
jgi:hypothetical protein